MNKKSTPDAKAKPQLPQGVSEDMIIKWKKDHVKIHLLSATQENGKERFMILKPLTRADKCYIATQFFKSNIYESGDYVVRNCVLAKDKEFDADDYLLDGAIMKAGSFFDFSSARLEEL